MDATAFWKVIGEYNSQTITVQIILMLFLVPGLILSYTGKIKWSAKLVLGVANLYIGIVFFGVFGTEPNQFFSRCRCICAAEDCYYLSALKTKMMFWENPRGGKVSCCYCSFCIPRFHFF